MTDSPRDDVGGVQQEKNVDRRVHQRRALTPRLYVVLHGSNSEGILYDVSEGGAALDIVGPKPEGEVLLVEFEMAETGQRLEAPARITWRDDTARKVGIHFMDLPEVSRTRIREWLKIISAAEADREAAAAEQLALQLAQQVDPPHESLVYVPDIAIIATSQIEAPLESQTESAGEQPAEPANDRLVQSLLDSFNKPEEKQNAQVFLSGWRPRRWIFVGAAIAVLVLLALGVAARRSPDHDAKSPSVSKAGQTANTAGAGQFDESGNRNPALLPGLDASLPASARPPCVNPVPPADKIRIYLWAEKDTPDVIVATYRKYLNAVLDVRVVDAAPYDLVLYVSGASVRAKTSPGDFVWSSRVFRPWYCESLGLLEQTEVHESLHYVPGAHVNQRIRSEVAYLILRALEGIRKENSR
jgi:PilZ domain